MEITVLLLLLAFLNVGGFHIVLRRIRSSTPKEQDRDELRDQLLAFKDIGASIQKLTQQQEEEATHKTHSTCRSNHPRHPRAPQKHSVRESSTASSGAPPA